MTNALYDKVTICWVFLIHHLYEKCILQIFAFIPLFLSAHVKNVTPPTLGQGLGTRLGHVPLCCNQEAFVGVSCTV